MGLQHTGLEITGKVRRNSGSTRGGIRAIVGNQVPELNAPEDKISKIVDAFVALQGQEGMYIKATPKSPLAKSYTAWQTRVVGFLALELEVPADIAAVKKALAEQGFDLNTTLEFLK